MNLNENILRVTGSAPIDGPLELAKTYAVGMEIAVTDERKVSNEDGTFDLEFKGKLVRAQIKTSTGEIVKTKDTRSQSTKTRYAIIASKGEFKPDMDDDAWYNFVQGGIRHNLRDIIINILKDAK